jgi:CheY-like chemotaxis protein
MATDSEFLQQVKDALSHLYDYPYLESHPLALRWPEPEQIGPNRAQRLHRLLLESIEELHPPGVLVKGTSRAEYYFLLVYRYIEEWPLSDIMQELGYSRRQFFRQQQKAVEMLASLLWEKVPQPKFPTAKPDNELDDELERFRTRYRAVNLREGLQGVLEIVGQLAEQHEVTLTHDLQAGLPVIYGSRTVLRQIFLNALSQLITQPGSQQIHLRISHERQRVAVVLAAEFAPRIEGEAHSWKLGLEPVRRLVEMMNGNWQAFEFKEQSCTCRFDFPAGAEKVLLVVEDNEAVIQAFRRYLADYNNYQVIGAASGAEALRLAREMNPTLITLDVMMPGQDGWEILHALKHDLTTQHIPVIICSVLEDPKLAQLLGAATYLRKPVVQADLLTTLDRLVGVR